MVCQKRWGVYHASSLSLSSLASLSSRSTLLRFSSCDSQKVILLEEIITYLKPLLKFSSLLFCLLTFELLLLLFPLQWNWVTRRWRWERS